MPKFRQGTHQPAFCSAYRGLETIIQYNDLLLNDRRYADRYLVTEITGLDDADVRDSREDNPESDGENAYNSFYSGRTVTIKGEIQAGSIDRLRQMQFDLKQAFNTLEESELDFIFGDWVEHFDVSGWTVNWNVSGANLAIVDGELVSTTTSARTCRLTEKTVFGPDVEVTQKIGVGSAVTTWSHRLIIKGIDDNNYLYAQMANGGALSIGKNVAGTPTTLDSVTTTTASILLDYWLSVKIVGNIVTAEWWDEEPSFDGVPIGTVSHELAGGNISTYGAAVSGQVGFYLISGSSNGTWTYDDFNAKQLTNSDSQLLARKVGKVDIPEIQAGKNARRSFMITLRASDPTLRSRGLLVTEVDSAESALTFDAGGAGLTFPSDGSGLIFGTTSLTVTNNGNYFSYPIVRFYGEMVDPALVNLNTGERISIETTIADGDYLEVDVFNRTIKDAGGTNRYGYLSNDHNWMKLSPGDTPLGLGIDSFSGSFSRVVVFWRHSWM